MSHSATPSSLRFFYRWAVYMALAVLVLKLDPFGLGSVTEALSQDAFNRMIDPLGSKGVEIAVVLITDKTLDEFEWHWPAPFSDHAKVLDAILDHGPRAVMVDFLFPEDRGSPGLLLETIKDYKDANVPLYFAEIPNRCPPIYEELWTAFDTKEGPRIPPRLVPVPSEVDYGVVRQYPAVENSRPTAAFQIYNDLAARDRVPAASSPRTPIDDDRPLALLWPLRDPEPKAVSCQRPGFWQQLFPGLTTGKSIRDSQSPIFDRCPSYSTIFVDQLLTPNMTPDRYGKLEEYLSDRIVFYGASIAGASDVAFTPTHGRLPGVYLHAAALDNLLSFGHGYKSEKAGHWLIDSGLTFNGIQIGILALLIAGMLVFEDFVRARLGDDTAWKQISTAGRPIILKVSTVTWLVFQIASAAFIMICIAIGYFWLDFAPVNGVGLWVLLALISGLYEGFFVRLFVEAAPFHARRLAAAVKRRLGAAR